MQEKKPEKKPKKKPAKDKAKRKKKEEKKEEKKAARVKCDCLPPLSKTDYNEGMEDFFGYKELWADHALGTKWNCECDKPEWFMAIPMECNGKEIPAWRRITMLQRLKRLE